MSYSLEETINELNELHVEPEDRIVVEVLEPQAMYDHKRKLRHFEIRKIVRLSDQVIIAIEDSGQLVGEI